MTRKRKAILFFTGFAIAVVVSLWFWCDKRDIRYEVIYPPGLSMPNSLANILGDHGEIVGSLVDDLNYAFFIWEPTGDITKIKRPEFENSQGPGRWIPIDINAEGYVAGHRNTKQQRLEAFLWTPEKGFILLGDLGGGRSEVCAINDKGMVVGSAYTADGRKHAFVWEEGKGMTDLTPDARESFSWAANNRGQVVGQMDTPGAKSFLWDRATGITSLDIKRPPGTFASVRAINDAGQVIGWFCGSKGIVSLFAWDEKNGTRPFNIEFTPHKVFLNSAGSIVVPTYSKGVQIGRYCLIRPSFETYFGNIDGEFVSLHKFLPNNMNNVWVLDMNNSGEILVHSDVNQGQLALLRPIEKTE
ncbi:MAG: hypothetical protein JXA82_11955 [Sedimentisphaerales bacterium]|nr:hypothetical protein [Sedimentisphaerales bacterium]